VSYPLHLGHCISYVFGPKCLVNSLPHSLHTNECLFVIVLPLRVGICFLFCLVRISPGRGVGFVRKMGKGFVAYRISFLYRVCNISLVRSCL
jgi:hypothetical protein